SGRKRVSGTPRGVNSINLEPEARQGKDRLLPIRYLKGGARRRRNHSRTFMPRSNRQRAPPICRWEYRLVHLLGRHFNRVRRGGGLEVTYQVSRGNVLERTEPHENV